MDDLKALAREAEAHEYFAANPDLRMTTGDHAKRAANLRAIEAALSRPAGGEWENLRESLQGCMEALSSYAPDCIEVQCAREALAAAPTPHGGEDAERMFGAGWMAAARWAERSDLVCDMDSAAYQSELDAAIAASREVGS